MKINTQLGIFQWLVKSKSVIHRILRKLEETESCEAKKPPGRPRKTTAREDRWIGNESKKDWFVTATAISKRANANLGIKISRHTISWRLNEKNLNSQVACMKLYISKKNKMSWLKLAKVWHDVGGAPGRWSLCLFWRETQTKGLNSRSPTRLEVKEERKVQEKTEASWQRNLERAVDNRQQKRPVGVR